MLEWTDPTGPRITDIGVFTSDDHTLWATRVAEATLLPDLRLSRRMGNILEDLANRPTDSIPQAAGGWARAKATYRFLENDRVAPAELTAGAARETARLCRDLSAVLVVQDTTSLNLTANRALAELGPIASSAGRARGLLVHTTLAMTPEGDVLGVLGQQFWARPRPGQPGPEEKESGKWVDGIDQARQALFESGPPPRLIHVMDREGDVYDVLQWVDELGDGAIIRSAQDRGAGRPSGTAHAAVAGRPALESRSLAVPRSHGHAAREARVELRALDVELEPDLEKYPHARPMTWTLIEVREPEPPEGVDALLWRLWTREPAATAAEAWEVVRKYTCRWPIEEFHLALKSGCRVERLRLESWAGLVKALALYSLVAARVVGLRDRSRADPEAEATVLLSVEECEVLAGRFGRGRSQGVPSLGQAALWVGRLGGHLNRKGDGMPGVRTLWRGFRDLGLLVEGYRVAKRLLE